MQIRVIQQTDPGPHEDSNWYKIDDFLPEDAAAIRAGTLVRYEVQIVRTEESGAVLPITSSYNHVGRPGLDGLYQHPWDIHHSAPEMIRAAKDSLTSAADLTVGMSVVLPGSRPDGAGRLFEVLEIPRDDEGYGLGQVVVRQRDALKGTPTRRLLVSVVSKEIGPRIPTEGRNRGGIAQSFRAREGGGFLVYHGEYADQVVMSPTQSGRALWGCRSIDELDDDAWEYGSDRKGAVRAHSRNYPNKGLAD
ncbi:MULTISPECIES: hypothetical protein [unclassified Streptomyces]|uniref:hypothetical protein n=1 Tax=unclassified Streptomyces TaxID=2593676 RepID=UPI003657FC17